MSSAPRRTGSLDHDGESIYYEVAGPEDGAWILLCHGAGGNHAVWHQQVAHFCTRHRVLVWDQRGFGRSTNRNGAASPAAARSDAAALVDHLGVKHAHVVGQSMGGWAAMGLAVSRPSIVMSLTLADTLAGIPIPPWTEGRVAPRPGRPVVGDHPALGVRFCTDHPDRALLYQQLGGWGVPEAERAGAVAGLFTTSFTAEQVAVVACPVLFIVGSDDEIFPPDWIRQAAARVPGARVEVVDGAGHSPYFEQAAVWNAIVEDHIGAADAD